MAGWHAPPPSDWHCIAQGPHVHDELRHAVRKALMQDNTKETLTFRHAGASTAADTPLGELSARYRAWQLDGAWNASA